VLLTGWKEVSPGREEVAATCELAAAAELRQRQVSRERERDPSIPARKKTAEKNFMWTQICFLEVIYGKLLEMAFFPPNTFWGVAKLQDLRRKK
jgi:hypothetical protein